LVEFITGVGSVCCSLASTILHDRAVSTKPTCQLVLEYAGFCAAISPHTSHKSYTDSALPTKQFCDRPVIPFSNK